jgi:hypothetical protein
MAEFKANYSPPIPLCGRIVLVEEKPRKPSKRPDSKLVALLSEVEEFP